MSTEDKTIFTEEIDTEILNEFNEVVDTISTDEEPFDVQYWLEAKMKEFSKQQKESFAWSAYMNGN